jgi:hypothetical protein
MSLDLRLQIDSDIVDFIAGPFDDELNCEK